MLLTLGVKESVRQNTVLAIHDEADQAYDLTFERETFTSSLTPQQLQLP